MTGRRVAALAALAALGTAAVFCYLGWDGALWDARLQLVLHLLAAAAVGGLWAWARAGGALPRTPLDLPILALLLAFAIATLSAWNTGLSARALTGIVATAAMLPVALLALRYLRAWTALAATVPIVALGLVALGLLAGRRLEWVLVGGPGLPPIRLGHEGTPFGSVAVPPFVILAALPIASLIPHRSLRIGVLAGLVATGLPLTVLSGSRSAWIAIAVAGLVFAGTRLAAGLRRLPLRDRWTPRRAGIGLLAAGGVLAIAALAGARLTEVSSLVYRGFLWRDTLAAWSADPLLGIGPGAMPLARQAAAPALSFPVRQPHSHNVALGILGDAGIIGLVAALAVAIAFALVAGPWRQRTAVGRAASAVLIGLGVGLLFEDLTFLPGFNLLVVLLASVALTEAGAVRWVRPRLTLPDQAAAGAAAMALGAVMLLGDAAAIAYQAGIDAAWHQRWPAAVAWLSRATALDPWHPTGPKSLAIAADRAGDPSLALASAMRAVELHPGDGPSWTNVAWLCLAGGDSACARFAADRAVERATAPGRELANAALVYEALGDSAAADHAYRLSLLTNHWTALTLPWPRRVEVGDGRPPELGVEAAELNLVIARAVAGEGVDADDYAGLHARMLALSITGPRDAAEAAVVRAIREARTSATTWELAALIRRHFGADVSHELAIGEVARGAPLAGEASETARATYDIATFRGYPADGLVAAAARLLPETPWPWVLEPFLAPAAMTGPRGAGS
ncbi:MAG TPA: O-antigen ligase family protein [Candidatus Limnocylindria bacterium]|nr:O-antigen ligase family protein [Candidatus Limnocylindria bacterium]